MEQNSTDIRGVPALREEGDLALALAEALLASPSDPLLVLGPEGRVLAASPAATALLSISAEALVGHSAADAPASAAAAALLRRLEPHRERVQQFGEQGEVASEGLGLRASGSGDLPRSRWILTPIICHHAAASPAVTAVLARFERRVPAREPRRSERRVVERAERHVHELLELVPAALYTCDAEGWLTFYNSGAARLWGREPPLGSTRWTGALRLRTAAGAPLAFEDSPIARALRDGRAVPEHELILERPDGSQAYVLAHSQPILDEETGQIVGAINVSLDNTARKQAELELRAANERLRRILDVNIIGIALTDEQARIYDANDYFLELLGATREDLEAGRVDWARHTPPEHYGADLRALEQLRDQGYCEPYEKEYERADGTRRRVRLHDALIPGTPGHIVAFVLDITPRQ